MVEDDWRVECEEHPGPHQFDYQWNVRSVGLNDIEYLPATKELECHHGGDEDSGHRKGPQLRGPSPKSGTTGYTKTSQGNKKDFATYFLTGAFVEDGDSGKVLVCRRLCLDLGE